MDKPYQEATQLIENKAQNHYQWGSERAAIEKSQTKGGMYEVNGIDHVNAKVEALSQKIESLTFLKMLETQISQVAQQQAALAAPAGTFPGQPEPNPKWHANAIHAITTRSGKELPDLISAPIMQPPDWNKQFEIVCDASDYAI
jgi:hypothetical protein